MTRPSCPMCREPMAHGEIAKTWECQDCRLTLDQRQRDDYRRAQQAEERQRMHDLGKIGPYPCPVMRAVDRIEGRQAPFAVAFAEALNDVTREWATPVEREEVATGILALYPEYDAAAVTRLLDDTCNVAF